MSVMLTVNLDFAFINVLEIIAIYLSLALTIISMMDYLIKTAGCFLIINKEFIEEKPYL